MLTFTSGDMFSRAVDIRINTVNCVGVMGAGVALAFKKRYPDMFHEYKRACEAGEIRPGRLHVWKSLSNDWIVNFPTKRHWKGKSRYEDIESGLLALREYLVKHGGVKVALPALGCGHGGLDWAKVSEMIRRYLSDLDADILVFSPLDSRAVGGSAKSVRARSVRKQELMGFAEPGGMKVLYSGEAGFPGGLVGEGVGAAYAIGNVGLCSRSCLTVLSSPDLSGRELQAAKACVSEVARAEIVLALLWSGDPSMELALDALKGNASVVFWLAEGMRNFDVPRVLSGYLEAGRVVVFSVAGPSVGWSRHLFEQSQNLMVAQASCVLVVDPDAVSMSRMVFDRVVRKTAVFYINYGDLSPEVVSQLRRMSARPIGRNADTGRPNVLPILKALKSDEPASELSDSQLREM